MMNTQLRAKNTSATYMSAIIHDPNECLEPVQHVLACFGWNQNDYQIYISIMLYPYPYILSLEKPPMPPLGSWIIQSKLPKQRRLAPSPEGNAWDQIWDIMMQTKWTCSFLFYSILYVFDCICHVMSCPICMDRWWWLKGEQDSAMTSNDKLVAFQSCNFALQQFKFGTLT